MPYIDSVHPARARTRARDLPFPLSHSLMFVPLIRPGAVDEKVFYGVVYCATFYDVIYNHNARMTRVD